MGKASRPTHRKAGYPGKKTVPTWSTTMHRMAISFRKLVSRLVFSRGADVCACVCVSASMSRTPLYGRSSPQPPRGLAPPGVGRKTKTLCRAMPTQREKGPFFKRHRRRNTTTKPPFTRKAGLSYNIPCGAAGWPLCRWYQHLRRFPGVGPLGNCRIFVFHDDYSRKRLLLQEGKPPRPIGPGRLISSHNPAPVRRC